MHLLWECKNETKVITKVLIDNEIYLVKGIANVNINGRLEKVIEVGQKYLACEKKGV